jgi:hypothetical protein
MEVNDYSYDIYSTWPSKPEAPATIAQKFLNTLDSLSRLDPVMQSWIIDDGLSEDGIPLEQARPKITDIIERGLGSGDDGIPNVRYGYGMFGGNRPKIDSSWFGLSVNAGGIWGNLVTLSTSDYDVVLDDSLIRYPLFKGALLAIITNWPAPWAKVQAFKSEQEHVPFGPGGAVEVSTKWAQRLTWLGYLSAERANGLTLPHDLLTERTPDGGLLMIAAEQRLDPSNPTHMRHANLITEIMTTYGDAMNYKEN